MRILIFAFASIFLLSILFSCSDIKESIPRDIAKRTDSLTLLAPGLINGPHYERDLAISPAGDELFFTRLAPRNAFSVIMHSRKTGDSWSDPEIAWFSGRYTDLEPAFHPNGKVLFFASNRPINPDSSKTDFDIWKIERKGTEWMNAENMSNTINTVANEFYPSVASNSNLYFTASYTDSKGAEDIYVSAFENGEYTTPVSLDSNINSNYFEFNAFIAPDESFLLFSSFGRADGLGGGDLYISRKNDTGEWQKASTLGSSVNSTFLDYSPFVYRDVLYLTSERHGFSDIQKVFTTESFRKMLNAPFNGNADIYKIGFTPK